MRSHSPGLRGRAFKIALALAVGTPLVVLGVGAARSQTTAVKPDANGYIPQATIIEIMASLVMPSAQSVWDAVAIDVTEKGTIEKKPQNDEEWAALRGTAVALAEATNLLIVPGRHAAPPGTKSENPDSELTPEKIDALLGEPASRLDRTRARAARGRDGGRASDRRQEHRRHLGRRRHDRRRVRGLPPTVLVSRAGEVARARSCLGRPRRAPAGLRNAAFGPGGPSQAAVRRARRASARLAGLVATRPPTVNTHAVSASDKAATTAFTILAAISFCHLLNDMMQSLLPGDLSDPEAGLRSRLRPDRPHHAHLPAHRVAAAAGDRLLHRPAAEAVLAAGRAWLHAARAAAALARAGELSDAAAGGGAGRHGLVGLPSGILARRADGARAAAMALRSRCSRSAATSARRSGRCCGRFIVLPHGQRSIAWFCAGGAARDRGALRASGSWYRHTAHARAGREPRGPRGRAILRCQRRRCACAGPR